MRRVPALDGLRAVAVTLVFLFHRATHFPGGWIGVDIFFVLSGFLITSLLAAEHDATGAVAFARFYAHRACRLLPALLLVLAAGLGLALWAHVRAHDTEIDAATALLYAEDYRYAFWPVHDSPLGHLWSLSVEEQFYFVWPLLLAVLLRRGRAAALRATLGLILAVIAWRGVLLATVADPFWHIYFAFDTRADELLVGCAAALGGPWLRRLPLARHLWPAALLLLAGVVLKFGPGGPWLPDIATFGYPLISLAAAYLVVLLVEVPEHPLARALGQPALVAFGRVSYGFYLWHYLIIKDRIAGPAWAVFALSLAAATLSYLLVERPIQRRGRAWAARLGGPPFAAAAPARPAVLTIR